VTRHTQSLLPDTDGKHICSSSANLQKLAGSTLCHIEEIYKKYEASIDYTHVCYVIKRFIV